MAASTQHSSPSSASASAAGIPKPTAATTPKHSPSASSLCTCKSFLFAAFVAFAAAVAAKRLETIRVQELDCPVPDRSFRAYHDVLGEACDNSCYAKLQEDIRVLGSDEVLWMDHSNRHRDTTMLESLARSIFEFHCGAVKGCGGEWWVQVRPAKAPALPDPMAKLPFHFDKDEWADDHLDKYRGPYLTSVTYLNPGTLPTLALDIRQTEDFKLIPNRSKYGSLARAFLGVPGLGTHIAFDGSLLHGAFMHRDFYLVDSLQDIPESRYVLVMSFWVNEYKPKAAGMLRRSKAAKMHKDVVSAFASNVELVNNVNIVSSKIADKMKLEGKETVDVRFRIAHATSTQRDVLEVNICLPKPSEIAKSNYSSYYLEFGESCSADVVSVTNGGVSIVRFNWQTELKETVIAAAEVWNTIPGFADCWKAILSFFSVSGGVGVLKNGIQEAIEKFVKG